MCRRTKGPLAKKTSPQPRSPNLRLPKKRVFLRHGGPPLQGEWTARHPRPLVHLVNRSIRLERFLLHGLSLIRANPQSAPPAASTSALSILCREPTRPLTDGGGSAGSSASSRPVSLRWSLFVVY